MHLGGTLVAPTVGTPLLLGWCLAVAGVPVGPGVARLRVAFPAATAVEMAVAAKTAWPAPAVAARVAELVAADATATEAAVALGAAFDRQGDYRAWQPQMEALASRYRVISYSRRYHYPNANPLTSANHSALVDAADLAHFTAALKLGAAHHDSSGRARLHPAEPGSVQCGGARLPDRVAERSVIARQDANASSTSRARAPSSTTEAPRLDGTGCRSRTGPAARIGRRRGFHRQGFASQLASSPSGRPITACSRLARMRLSRLLPSARRLRSTTFCVAIPA